MSAPALAAVLHGLFGLLPGLLLPFVDDSSVDTLAVAVATGTGWIAAVALVAEDHRRTRGARAFAAALVDGFGVSDEAHGKLESPVSQALSVAYRTVGGGRAKTTIARVSVQARDVEARLTETVLPLTDVIWACTHRGQVRWETDGEHWQTGAEAGAPVLAASAAPQRDGHWSSSGPGSLMMLAGTSDPRAELSRLRLAQRMTGLPLVASLIGALAHQLLL